MAKHQHDISKKIWFKDTVYLTMPIRNSNVLISVFKACRALFIFTNGEVSVMELPRLSIVV